MSVVGTAKERVGLREKRTSKDERYYKRTFLVTCDDLKDDPNVVETAFGLPKYGFPYVTEKSVDLLSRCTQLSSKQTSLYAWEVEAEYSITLKEQDNPDNPDPIFDPPTYTWSGTNIREVITGESEWVSYQDPNEFIMKKATGILNSAKEPYNPPAEIDRLIPQLTFERNEPTFNHRYMLYYVNSINDRKWYGWHKKTVKIASISGSAQFKEINGILRKYWKVQYVLQFNKYTWDLFLLDIGTYYFEGGFASTGAQHKIPFMTKGGVPGLGLLTSDGDKSTTISRYNRFDVLDRSNFNLLQIPLIF